MKKPSLIEEIKRFHEVSGNKNVISENFLDDLLKKVGLKGDEKNTKKVDDPKKADLVSDDVIYIRSKFRAGVQVPFLDEIGVWNGTGSPN